MSRHSSHKTRIAQYRAFLKDSIRLAIDFSQTAQSRGIAPPPVQKPFPEDAKRIDLVSPGGWGSISGIDLETAIRQRRSRRDYSSKPLSSDDLSFLLWATQGIREHPHESTAFRTVPSAGCRHAFEAYPIIMNVEGVAPGIYRYLPLQHQLLEVMLRNDIGHAIARAGLGQAFLGRAAVTFVWTALPERMEWRYDLAAHKVIALDAGHVCQNLYLAVEAINAGCCAVAAYHQQELDELLGVDGEEEFAVYLAGVGKVKK